MLVEWRETNDRGATVVTGTCIEVARDADATWAETLCGLTVTLPGAAIPGMRPTCLNCRDRDAARRGTR